MDTKTYTENIKERLAVNFMISNIADGNGYGGEHISDMAGEKEGLNLSVIADYHNIWDRTPFDVEEITDKYQIHETCYIKEAEFPSISDIEGFFDDLTMKARNIELPENHFYTDVTGVLVCSRLPEGTERKVQSLNFDKIFRFLKQGFVSVRLVCVDLEAEKVYTNKAGRKLKDFYNILKYEETV